jgi:hypothetical protein
MAKKVIITTFSILSLIGVFLPIATNGYMYIDVYQMKGTASLLYVISIALVVFSAANLFRKIEDAKLLLIATSLFGFIILIYNTAEAVKTINYTIQKNIEFENITSKFLKDFIESRRMELVRYIRIWIAVWI